MSAVLLIGLPLLILGVVYVDIIIPLRSINKNIKQVMEELKIIQHLQGQPMHKQGE